MEITGSNLGVYDGTHTVAEVDAANTFDIEHADEGDSGGTVGMDNDDGAVCPFTHSPVSIRIVPTGNGSHVYQNVSAALQREVIGNQWVTASVWVRLPDVGGTYPDAQAPRFEIRPDGSNSSAPFGQVTFVIPAAMADGDWHYIVLLAAFVPAGTDVLRMRLMNNFSTYNASHVPVWFDAPRLVLGTRPDPYAPGIEGL